MATINIDRNTFPSEGGSFKISLTKDNISTWGTVTVPSTTWYNVGEMTDVSPFLYTIDVDVDANTSGSSRTMSIGVTVDGQSELFSVVQPSGAALSANIVSATSGNIAAAGGQVTVDVQSVNGTDSLSTASSNQAYCTLTSTTHNITSGGVTCTRFVFTFSQNTSTSPRSATLTFTVADGGGNTATATLSKTQNGAPVQSGSLSVASQNVAAASTTYDSPITAVDIQNATLQVDTTTFNFVTSAVIQIVDNQLVLTLAYPANTGASARTETIQISGTDTWGNSLTATMTLTQAGTTLPTDRITDIHWTNTSPNSDTTSAGYEGFNERIILAYTGTWSGDATISYPSDDRMTVTKISDAQFRVQYSAGNISENKVYTFVVSRNDSNNNPVTANAYLRLTPSGVFPIWEDVFGTITSDEDWEDYEIQEDGALLYAGRAFAYPDESDIRVNLSRVVAPYLTGYYKDVTFHNDGNQIGSYTFVRDYSYDKSMDYTSDLWLNKPINGRVPSGIKLSVAKWGATSGGSLQVTESGGSLVVNETMAKGLNLGEWISGSAGQRYTFGSEFYEVVDACQVVVLKYVNAYGGTDFLLVEGVSKKTDKITRASYEKDAAAMTVDFETTDYQAAMEASWQGTTGWLTDAQSLRMKHLVESVEVYMLTEDGEEVPVVMKDTSLEYKTFRTSGKTLVNYTLNWTESQKKLRR